MRSIALFGVALALAVQPVVTGQIGLCPSPVDDGFNVGCCNPPQPNLPSFPSISTDGKWGCLLSCNLENEHLVLVSLSPPQFVACDQAVISITVNPQTGTGMAFTGLLLAKYARTWTEPTLPGAAPKQVWRFLLNGDVSVATAGVVSVACPVPPCALPPTSLPVHLWGSIDYTCTPPLPTGVPGWSARLDLTHGPGCLQHAFFAQRPLTGSPAHIQRSYHLVAPGSFVFVPAPEPAGPITAESARDALFDIATGNYMCFGEAPVVQGSLSTALSNCLCSPITPVVGPWKHQALTGVVTCAGAASSFTSVPFGGTFPTGFVALTLGTYVSAVPANPPRDLTIYWGVLQYAPPCKPNAFPYHAVHGVGTSGVPGFLFSSVIPSSFQHFIDLQNHKVFTPLGLLPGFGSLAVGDEVWNLNIP